MIFEPHHPRRRRKHLPILRWENVQNPQKRLSGVFGDQKAFIFGERDDKNRNFQSDRECDVHRQWLVAEQNDKLSKFQEIYSENLDFEVLVGKGPQDNTPRSR